MTEPVSGRSPFSQGNPLAASYLCVFLYSSSEAALHVLVPPYLADGLGFRPGVIGVLLAVFAVSSLVMRLPVGAGYSASRVRPLLLAGGLLSAGAFVVLPLVDSVAVVGVVMAMDGIGWAMATTTQLTVLVASRPDRLTLASVMGWYSGFTGLGHAVGGVTAGAVADGLGYTAAFLVLAAFPAFATAVMLRSLRAQLAATPGGSSRDGGVDTADTGDAAGERHDRDASRPAVSAVLKAARAMPAAVYGGALVMFFINVQSALFTTFHPVLALAAGLTLTQIGMLAGCRSLASSVTRMASGPLFTRYSGAGLTTPMVVLGVATLFLLPVVRESFWWQVVLFAAAGLSRGILRVTGAATAFEGGDGGRHGLVSAFLHMGLDLGKVVGPPLGGLVAELVGVAAMFQVCAVVLLLTYLGSRVNAMRRRPGVPGSGPAP